MTIAILANGEQSIPFGIPLSKLVPYPPILGPTLTGQ